MPPVRVSDSSAPAPSRMRPLWRTPIKPAASTGNSNFLRKAFFLPLSSPQSGNSGLVFSQAARTGGVRLKSIRTQSDHCEAQTSRGLPALRFPATAGPQPVPETHGSSPGAIQSNERAASLNGYRGSSFVVRTTETGARPFPWPPNQTRKREILRFVIDVSAVLCADDNA